MSLWTWNELVRACGIASGSASGTSAEGPVIDGISIDTRTLGSGDLFVALSGNPGPGFHTASTSARDGHDFAMQAGQAGAAAIMTHQAVAGDLPELRVPDTLQGLWDLARFSRGRMAGKVVAITGSSGKTTARVYLQHVLQAQGLTHGATGSLNNHWGLPLSMSRMPGDAEYGIFEIGMNHPGEIAPLAKLANPDIALLLNVLPVHIEYFENLDAIRQEKLTIASGLTEHGTLVLPDDLDHKGITNTVVTFGFSEQADVRCTEVKADSDGQLVISVDVAGTQARIELGCGGEHRILTSLAVLAVCHVLGIDMGRACESLATAQPPEGRGNQFTINGVGIIDDSYNANPSSVAYALDSLAAADFPDKSGMDAGNRRIAILGDMLELGAQSSAMHAGLLSHCAGLDQVIAVGEQMHGLYHLLPEAQQWFCAARASDIDLDELCDSLHPGDLVLIKGSNKIFWAENFVVGLVDRLRRR
jgi:UDP-N-acetylmuramoyl-tripeptide--D-alanyl-D-alanine ligase